MSQAVSVNEEPVDGDLIEILLAHLDKEECKAPFLIKNGVKVVL